MRAPSRTVADMAQKRSATSALHCAGWRLSPPSSSSRVPNGRVPKGRVPKGRVPKGRVPKGRVPKGRVPKGRVPKGRVPKGRVPKGRVPKGRSSDGAPPSGSSSQALRCAHIVALPLCRSSHGLRGSNLGHEIGPGQHLRFAQVRRRGHGAVKGQRMRQGIAALTLAAYVEERAGRPQIHGCLVRARSDRVEVRGGAVEVVAQEAEH